MIVHSITDAHKSGVAHLIREADKEGVIVLERGGSKVSMIVPLTIPGLSRFIAEMQKIRESDDPDTMAYVEQIGSIIKAKVSHAPHSPH